ncbi:MAG: sulfatase-like hydrolase/transferase [Thermoplasmata archaeon]
MDSPNIILVVFDTLRSNVWSVYGGDVETPYMRDFLRDSNIFPRPIAPSPWTAPSHMSFFTGFYPGEHGVHEDMEHGDGKVLEKIFEYDGENIISKLRDIGYTTIGYSTNPWLSPGTGFDRYFNSFTFFSSEYMNIEEMNAVNEYKKYGKNRYQAAKNLLISGNFKEFCRYYKIHRRIIKRKREVGYPFIKGSDIIVDQIMNSSYEQPFFLFINLMEAHEPSAPWELDTDDRKIKYLDLAGKDIISEKRMNETREGYKRSLGILDRQFGRLVEYLKKMRIYENTMIIVTSDHGQALKEERKVPYYGHGNFLYDEIIEVPLIIKFHGNRKIDIKNGNQSLVNLPEQIISAVEGNFDDFMTSEYVFSESFGPVHDLETLVKEGVLPSDIDYVGMRNKILYPKKAVYWNKYKMVVNGLTGEIDEFKEDGKDIDQYEKKDVLDHLREQIYIFKGKENFKV